MSLPTNDLASPDRDQIGTVAGIRSEWPAGIVGIRRLDTLTLAFAVDASGAQSSTTPLSIADASGNRAWEAGVYAQDEWTLTGKLTLNYGARYDRFDASFGS